MGENDSAGGGHRAPRTTIGATDNPERDTCPQISDMPVTDESRLAVGDSASRHSLTRPRMCASQDSPEESGSVPVPEPQHEDRCLSCGSPSTRYRWVAYQCIRGTPVTLGAVLVHRAAARTIDEVLAD